MKIKIFDEEHEMDLEESVNAFLEELNGKVVDIKYSTYCFLDGKEQVYSFSAMIIYE